MKVFDKLALGSVAVIVITNPASGSAILNGLEAAFEKIFQYGSPINFGATIVLLGYVGYRMWQNRSVTTVPAKGKKTAKAGAYLTT